MNTKQALQVVLDCVDYTVGNCRINAMVGAALPREVIELAKKAIRSTTTSGKRVKKDWELPVCPIEKCPRCNSPVKPVAYMDATEWCLGGWDCNTPCDEMYEEYEDFEWPFVENVATGDDFKDIGFMVIH